MEVFFVDVGLGSCQVILLGGRRAIVLDCGVLSDHIAQQFLLRNGIEKIDRLIASHTDNDHTGGAITILDHYASVVEKICVIQDHKFLTSKYWRRICALRKEGVISKDQIAPPILPDDQPKLIWEDGKSGAKLICISPTFLENLDAQGNENANSTSAVLVLEYLDKRIVFAGDSVIPQWREIYERRNNRTLECDVLAVPHHGGHMDDKPEDLEWLYQQAVNCDVAILSVGTVKTPHHPREEVVAQLRRIGATVLCTEITKKCHYDPQILKPGVLKPQTILGRAMNAPTQQGVACAGTVKVEISDNGCRVERSPEHQSAVDQIALESLHGKCPLCRLAVAPEPA
jgi:beta-lactamase superfamily II metal-dependent hydrolase